MPVNCIIQHQNFLAALSVIEALALAVLIGAVLFVTFKSKPLSGSN